jgi:threonine/homoserine/homoserine lactone efflux protein
MDGQYLLLGIVLGLSIAAPVGPIGILVIRRTLACGRRSGFATGLGAATADGLYAVVAASGLTVIGGLLAGHIAMIRVLGGFFLVFLGIGIFLSQPAEGPGAGDNRSLPSDYATALLLTLTNPATLLSFTGIFAAFGTGHAGGDAPTATLMVAGIAAGSVLWWLVLVGGIAAIGSRCGTGTLRLANRVSGTVLAAFGVFAISGGGHVRGTSIP